MDILGHVGILQSLDITQGAMKNGLDDLDDLVLCQQAMHPAIDVFICDDLSRFSPISMELFQGYPRITTNINNNQTNINNNQTTTTNTHVDYQPPTTNKHVDLPVFLLSMSP